MTSLRPRTLRLWSATGLCVAGLMLAGCSATNPMTTEKEYSASDGVRATLGDVRASNLMVLSSAKGAPGAVQGALTNDGATTRTVTLTAGDDTATVNVEPGQTVLLTEDTTGGAPGDGRENFTIPAVSVAPGALLPITIATDTAGSQDLAVPVLDGSQPEYATLIPTPTPSA
ncbi:hypothetical protein IC607_10670 [Cellulomonas sp. JH27-2]|uniref:hypothetical protein n=1 Tax=Cellulomonas sp. JH27-2 TaxID=2774139 RepID=UPI001782AC51|nr:hypothetical protein [Cellulomonas sp. JH27-2]